MTRSNHLPGNARAYRGLRANPHPSRGRGADPRRSRDAGRRAVPPLLAAGGARIEARGRTARGADPGRGPRRVPGPGGPGRGPAPALLPPRRVARVRHRLAARNPLLLPRLAVRCRRGDPGDPRRAAREPHPAHRLAGRVSGPRVRGPRLRLHGTAGQHPAVPALRYLRAARQPPDPLLALASVQLAAASREHDGPGACGVPPHPRGRRAAHRGVGRDARVRLPSDPERHDVHHRQALGRLRLDSVQPHHPAELRAHRGAVGGRGRAAPVHPRIGHALDGTDRRHPHRGPRGAGTSTRASTPRATATRPRSGRTPSTSWARPETAPTRSASATLATGTRRCRSARSRYMRWSIGAAPTRA